MGTYISTKMRLTFNGAVDESRPKKKKQTAGRHCVRNMCVERSLHSHTLPTKESRLPFFVLSPKCCWLASFGSSLKGQGRERGREGVQSRCIDIRRSEGSS